MTRPVFRDPVEDGATDPTVIRRSGTDEWWMFYTQRRAQLEGTGVEWVHGSRIGIAVSVDGGVTWAYRGVVEGLDAGGDTHWAPEVVRLGDTYHLYLTWIAGAPDSWYGHERHIVHYTSDDLVDWTRVGRLDLGGDRLIDAAVARTGDGRLRMWFKDEAADSTTFAAVSDDGYTWHPEGLVVAGDPHEGPNVFELGGWYWLIVDEWRGQRVLRSRDGIAWDEQERRILDSSGRSSEDRQVGRHADVVVRDDGTAIVFYFTHPNWDGVELADVTDRSARVSAVHVALLTVVGDVLVADRDLPVLTERYLY